jgi:TRAP-type transport system periplasmic protein
MPIKEDAIMKRYFGLFALLVIMALLVSMVLSCAASAPPSTVTSSAPTAPASPAAQQKVSLRLVIPNPPGDDLTVNAEEFAAAIAKRTNGRYEVKVFPGETIVKVPEIYDALRTGAIEMAVVGIGIFEGMDPRLAELPMSVFTVRANAAAAEPFGQLVSKNVLEQKLNIKVLGCYGCAGQELWSTRPIKTLEDWKGVLCGASNPELVDVVTAWGGAPVNMAWTDYYSALQKKTIDACLNSLRACIAFSIPDVAKHLTLCFSSPVYVAYHINIDTLNKMPADIQKIFQEEVTIATKRMQEHQIQMREGNDLDVIRKAGVNIYELPKAEFERWRTAFQPYLDKKLAAQGDFGVQHKAILDKANTEFPYVGK